MEFCGNPSKFLKTPSDNNSNDLSSVFSSRFVKESPVDFNSNNCTKEHPLKISIDRNNNKHLLSPLGHSQGPRGIKVSRLSLQISESSIRHSLIYQFGNQTKFNQSRSYNIKSIVLESAAGPSPTRWAIITFLTSSDAEKALQLATKSNSVELHPGYDLFDIDDLELNTNVSQCLDEFHGKASRTLQISNLPSHLNNFKTLHEYFSKFGKVLDIDIKPKLVPHASALVQFSDISKVVKILVNPRSVLKGLVGSSITSSTSFQFGPSFPTNCIWLGQVPVSVTEMQITEFFSRFGHVLEVVQDLKQQKALVYMDNAYAAQQSIIHLKRKNSVLGTNRVQVDYASLECQATISYWLSNNFPTLPVPPDISSPRTVPPDTVNNTIINSLNNRLVSRSAPDKIFISTAKPTNSAFEPNSQTHPQIISKLPECNSTFPSDSSVITKNSQIAFCNPGLNNLTTMVLTERFSTDNAPKVAPICNKRTNNNNINRTNNTFDSNCDNSNPRIFQSFDGTIHNIPLHSINQITESNNANIFSLKKDRVSLETDLRSQSNLRLSSPQSSSTNPVISQSNDNTKPDINRQFVPWNTPVRNRVVARVDPFSHTRPVSSQMHVNVQNKSFQTVSYSSRMPNPVSTQMNKTGPKAFNFSDKELNYSTKDEQLVNVNKTSIQGVTDCFKRRTNYNQPLTYRVAKSSDTHPRSFDERESMFCSKLKTKNNKYLLSELSVSEKPITAAEVFGEDFSDLSDTDSTPSYLSPSAVITVPNNRKRKSMLLCKSPNSSDSSSTVSVLSSEKQSHYLVSQLRYRTNKKLYLKTSKDAYQTKKTIHEIQSSDEDISEKHSSSRSRRKMKFSIKEKLDKKNGSMKPLTVNVSLTNFDENELESDETSSRTTENSYDNCKSRMSKSKNASKTPNVLHVSKRPIHLNQPEYKNEESFSSSSGNEDKNVKVKRYNANLKSKYVLSDDQKKVSTAYHLEHCYKGNKISKVSESKTHSVKATDESGLKLGFIPSNFNCIQGKRHYEEDRTDYRNNFSHKNRNSSSSSVRRKKIRLDALDKTKTDHLSHKKHEFHSQKLNSDAVFQKEYDDFKRDQAEEKSKLKTKSKLSSTSSVGATSISSYEKYESKGIDKSTKTSSFYSTSDSKNIFQIDMSNINIYESMYDKVKRRAQKQAEIKINQQSPEIAGPRKKRKNKPLPYSRKHPSKEKHRKRSKTLVENVSSPPSTVYSDGSSALVDDSQSNYSTTVYGSFEKDMQRNKRFKDYKHSKGVHTSSLESLASSSVKNWKNVTKDSGSHYSQQSKITDHSVYKISKSSCDADHEERDYSDYSYKTNISAKAISSKEEKKSDDDIANGSDGTASTEPMEYAEVDLESMKLSDDDWKSGLSYQSSCESGNIIKDKTGHFEITVNTNLCSNKMSQDNTLIVKGKSENSESDNLSIEKDLKNDVSESSEFKNKDVECTLDSSNNTNEIEDIKLLDDVKTELDKEEQDIAIASIMLKEESEIISPLVWKCETNPSLDATTESSNSDNSLNNIVNETSTAESYGNINDEEQQIATPKVISFCESDSTYDHKSETEAIGNVFLSIETALEESVTSSSSTSNVISPNVINSDSQVTNVSQTPEKIMEQFNNEPTSTSTTQVAETTIYDSINTKVYPAKQNNIGSTNTSDKEDLTSYVKSVIERVMQEQNAENQNKVKVEKGTAKRNKRFPNVATVKVASITNSTPIVQPVISSVSVQKSPPASFQAAILEPSDTQCSVSSASHQGAFSIPGVNVCSPVNGCQSNVGKSMSDNQISEDLQRSNPKNLTIDSNSTVISVKVESDVIPIPVEVKVNTEPTCSIEVTVVNDAVISSVSSNNNLKSSVPEDQNKRILTRLRKADPSKSDSNYKVVSTSISSRSDINSRPYNNNNTDQPINDHDVSTKVSLKQLLTEQTTITSTKVEKSSDPYEPNFDESPLELSRYRKKSNIFFPNSNKSDSQSPAIIGIVKTATNITNASLTTTVPATVATTTSIDTVSQIIEDVAQGNFNYSEYLSSFRNGKIMAFQISPSSTPLTFVSNDSRDCSSVSAENLHSSVSEGSNKKDIQFVKSSASVSSSDDKKSEYSSSSASSTHKSSHCQLFASTSDNRSNSNVHNSDKSIFAFSSKASNPTFTAANVPHINSEFLAFFNQTLFCKTSEAAGQKSMTNTIGVDSTQSLHPIITSIQLQPCTRDITAILPNSTLSFDKDTSLNQAISLNMEPVLQPSVSKSGLLNITVNPVQTGPLISSVQPPDDKNPLRPWYMNYLQGPQMPVDSAVLSKLQNMLNDSGMKSTTHQSESNIYRIGPTANQVDSTTLIDASVTQQSQNISSKLIDDMIIPREYPLVWEGKLSLKNEEAKVALHFVHGNTELLNACMHLLRYSGSLQWNNSGSLKIVQRMRLDASQLEGVQRRMQNTNEYCIGLALPGGEDVNQWMRQSQILKEGFIKYMRDKGAAGIINVCHPENNQQGLYVVHIFPPCDFATNQLTTTAPDLATIVDNNKFPNLLVVITTV